MAKKKNTIPSGFEDVLCNIFSNAEQGESITNIDDLPFDNELPFEEEKEDEKVPPVNTEDGKNKTDDTLDSHEDTSDIPKDIINNDNKETTEVEDEHIEDETEPTDADVIEAQQVGLLFDAVGQSLGWNMADVDEKDRPLTTQDLANYFAEVVKLNSIPEYADERIQKLDEYVKNGGKFEDFYEKQREDLSLDGIDIEDESNQKAIIRQLLKYNNYTDEQINKKISRYEDADMLFEESEDALERLKVIKQQEVEEAARRQEELAKAQEQLSREFFETVSRDINSLQTVRGIQIPKEDRKALFDYIFKVDQNGVTQYQKDFNKNLSKNLIESAYFTMKADALISSAEKKGESSATEKLRKLLRHTTKNHTVYNADEKQKSVTDLLAGAF